MKAIREVGWSAACRYAAGELLQAAYGLLLWSPLRVLALRVMGARIGADVVVHRCRFFNLYRTGWRGLRVGANAFIGDECLIDLADTVTLEEHVTLAERVTVLTHMNVGYADHPLQVHFPSSQAPVCIRRGAFVGACATVLPGVEIGTCAVVAAGAVVRSDVPSYTVVGGVPAKVLRQLPTSPEVHGPNRSPVVQSA